MNVVFEEWRETLTLWAANHPVRVDYLMAGIASLAGLWLLITIIRVLMPKKKASAPAAEYDIVEERAAEDAGLHSPRDDSAPHSAPPETPVETLPPAEGETTAPGAVEGSPPDEPTHEPTREAPVGEAPVGDFPIPNIDEAPLQDADTFSPRPSQTAPAPIDEALPEPAPLVESPDWDKLPEPVIDYSRMGSPIPPDINTEDIDVPLDDFTDRDLNVEEIDEALFEDASQPPLTGFSGQAPANDDLIDPLSDAEDDAAFDAALGAMKRRSDTDAPPPDLEPEAPVDEVDVSVFTPYRVLPDQAFILQAIFHVEEAAPQAAEIATAIDPDAEQRLSKTLRQAVRHGQVLTASLDIPDAEIDTPVQAFTWRGDIEPLQFIVTIPRLREAMSALAKLQISLDGVPVASAVWRIMLSDEADVANETGVFIPINHYRRAFVSYSSKDRVEVLKRVQGLQAAGLEVFQDVLDLEPGERWSQALYMHIDDADAFYLFWSENSADSEWVRKEWRYALERSMTHPDRRPDICPVILSAPPPMPPEELSDRHFNDILAYVLKAHEQG